MIESEIKILSSAAYRCREEVSPEDFGKVLSNLAHRIHDLAQALTNA